MRLAFLRLVILALLAAAPLWSQSPVQSEAPPKPPAETSAQPSQMPSVPPDSTKLEPEKTVKADYPAEAREKQIQGEVVIKFEVNEQGDVTNAEVVSGDPILAKSALAAAKQWKFKPFIRHGKPEPVNTKIPFDFYFSGNAHELNDKNSVELKPVSPSAAASAPDQSQFAQPAADQAKDNSQLRVRVSQGILQRHLVHQVQPVYPYEARHDHIQGSVVMKALIGKDGHVKNLEVLSGPKELVAAATGAVEQWRYEPWIYNGEPVEVETLITVNFNLR